MRPARPAPGFTLVEILVGLVIGLFLTAGMVQMYAANQRSARFNEALARVQESGRYALEMIATDLRMADFWGCGQGNNVTNRINDGSGNYSANLHEFVAGLDGVDGTPDEITIRGATGAKLIVQGHSGGNATDPVVVPGTQSNVEGTICGFSGCIANSIADVVLVTDCEDGDIFQVTSLATGSPATNTNVGFTATGATGTPGNDASGTLTKVYDDAASLYVLRVARYHVAAGVTGQNGLFRAENTDTNGEEIAEGVEDMQIVYGEDTDGDGTANRYVPRGNLADINAVVSVRVNLLLASPTTNVADTDQVIAFNGADVTCPNRRICQVMSATIAVRNRTR